MVMVLTSNNGSNMTLLLNKVRIEKMQIQILMFGYVIL